MPRSPPPRRGRPPLADARHSTLGVRLSASDLDLLDAHLARLRDASPHGVPPPTRAGVLRDLALRALLAAAR